MYCYPSSMRIIEIVSIVAPGLSLYLLRLHIHTNTTICPTPAPQTPQLLLTAPQAQQSYVNNWRPKLRQHLDNTRVVDGGTLLKCGAGNFDLISTNHEREGIGCVRCRTDIGWYVLDTPQDRTRELARPDNCRRLHILKALRRRFSIGCRIHVEDDPFMSNLHVIGARNCDVFIYWRRVSRIVSRNKRFNAEGIAEVWLEKQQSMVVDGRAIPRENQLPVSDVHHVSSYANNLDSYPHGISTGRGGQLYFEGSAAIMMNHPSIHPYSGVSEEIWTALNSEVLRADEGEVR
ncbi:hypothetical protein PR048_022153 [Dryococelus australis]|uniref:FHA domain-containing protein n=1 Tax=Dryococelus australis TaxID=614101 RepID=A0ABQ9H081_9NEOP|nr:hypothetical protein PR048_022153 [Dryococelus australis]